MRPIKILGNGVLKFDSDECDNLVVDYDIYTESKGLPNNYTQTIFEDYEENIVNISKINLEDVVEIDDNTDLQGELACSGGSCEIT